MSKKWFIGLLGIALFAGYVLIQVVNNYNNYFGSVMSPGKTSAEWGQFGDYVGGLTNPILSLINILLFVILAINVRDIENKRIKDAQEREDRILRETREYEDNRSKDNLEVQKLVALNQFRHEAFKELKSKINIEIPESFKEFYAVFRPIARFLSDYNYYNGYLFNSDYAEALHKLIHSSLQLAQEGEKLKNCTLPPEIVFFSHSFMIMDEEDRIYDFNNFIENYSTFSEQRRKLKSVIQHIIIDKPYIEPQKV